MDAGTGLVAADVDLLGILVAAQSLLNILGDVHNNRSGLAGAGDVKGLFDNAAQILPAADGDGVLGDAAGDANNIHFLEGVISDQIEGNLSGEADQRHAVVVGRGDAGDQVGGSGTAGDQTDADPARGTGVAVGRVDQPLLVAGKHHFNFPVIVKRVEEIDGLASRIAEKEIHAFCLQRFDKQFCSFYLFHIFPPF